MRTESDSVPLMHQLARWAGCPTVNARRMVLVLDVGHEPRLYIESLLRQQGEGEQFGKDLHHPDGSPAPDAPPPALNDVKIDPWVEHLIVTAPQPPRRPGETTGTANKVFRTVTAPPPILGLTHEDVEALRALVANEKSRLDDQGAILQAYRQTLEAHGPPVVHEETEKAGPAPVGHIHETDEGLFCIVHMPEGAKTVPVVGLTEAVQVMKAHGVAPGFYVKPALPRPGAPYEPNCHICHDSQALTVRRYNETFHPPCPYCQR